MSKITQKFIASEECDGSNTARMTDLASCAYKLKQYNRWRRGEEDIGEHGPDPKELGLLIDFAADALNAMSGHDHLMVIAATRYCLGRMTYIVGDCCDWLRQIWPLLHESTQKIIQRDIEEAFARDDDDRASGREFKELGHDCDRKQWERVRVLWMNEE